MKTAFNQFGVVRDEEAFQDLVDELVPLAKKFEGRMNYRDLYSYMSQAATAAVGVLVCRYVNKRESEGKKVYR